MQSAPKITFHGIDPSDALEELIHRRCAQLDKRWQRILSCEIVIEAPQKRQRHGRVFEVHLTVSVPGPDIVVSREVGQSTALEDVHLAIHEVFDTAERLTVERKHQLARHPDNSRTIA